MKLSDLIPSKATLDGLQGVEKQLQSRRYTSAWSLVFVILAGVFQVLKLLLSDPTFARITDQLQGFLAALRHCTRADVVLFFTSLQAIIIYVAVIAAIVWLTTRYTGILFKQSSKPFRYTFSIEDFTRVKDTPPLASFDVERLDQMNLLRNDLIERLKRRVQRFSLLEIPARDGAAPVDKEITASSHFHIKAEYAIREDESGEWILHVWPRIRIGADANSFTLAYPVRLPIMDGSNPAETATKGILDLQEYQSLVERVYSSIATEIYKQIEIDLHDKMTLFPTLSLRALARYVEAEDFETSNTIDAYDRALEMYQTSLEELKASRLHWFKKLVRVRSALRAEAKTKLGYSRCLIYRRLVSEMAGRNRNPIFASRQKSQEAIDLLRQAYNSFWFGRPLPKRTEDFKEADIAVAYNAIGWPLWRKRNYRKVRGELCETLAVAALAHSLLDDSSTAAHRLRLAETLGHKCPDRTQLLLLLAKAQLEPTLPGKLIYLNQGKELDLDSEIVLYQFAYCSDLLARSEDKITSERVDYLNGNYEGVLKVNPANIASLIGQGYLLWIVDALDKAAKKLKAGIELQKIVAQTFVGDLKYCLARVIVEQVYERVLGQLSRTSPSKAQTANDLRPLNQAVFFFEEATDADPSVAASYIETQDKSRNTYYEFINPAMLAAYARFAKRTEALSQIPQLDQAVANNLSGYALNDHGNACLNHYLRSEVPTAANKTFSEAIRLLDKARPLCSDSLRGEYNYFWALTTADDEEASPELFADRAKMAERLLKSSELPPAAVLVAAVTERIQQEVIKDYTEWPAEVELEELLEISKGKKQGYRELLEDAIKKLTRDSKEPEFRATEDHLKDSGGIDQQPRESPEKQNYNLSPQAVGSQGPLDEKRKAANQQQQKASQTAGSQSADNLSKYEKALQKIQLLDDLEKPVQRFVREKTRLSPFEKQLFSSDNAATLLKNTDIEWSDFGDKELYALKAMADIWGRRPDPGSRKGSRFLCEFILDKFRPNAFNVNWTLFGVTDESEKGKKRRLIQSMKKDIEDSLSYDSKSCAYMRWTLYHTDLWISIGSRDWPYAVSEQAKNGDYFIKRYKSAELTSSRLAVFPSFHRRLAKGYEIQAKELVDTLAEVEKTLADVEEKLGLLARPMQHFRGLKRQLDDSSGALEQSRQALTEISRIENLATGKFIIRLDALREKLDNSARRVEEFNSRPGIGNLERLARTAWNGLARKGNTNAESLIKGVRKTGLLSGRIQKLSNGLGESIKLHVRERRAVCKLNPNNQSDRGSLLDPLGKLILGSTLEDPFEKHDTPFVFEVEFSGESTEDLGFTKDALPDTLKKIGALRSLLKQDAGFVLPGINFRDNAEFQKGMFRFLIRGVPSPFGILDIKASKADQWTELMKFIEEAARRNAAQLFTSQDCYQKLAEIAKAGIDCADIQTDSNSVFALTWVLKMLLAERTPITGLSAIVPEFRRCQARKLGLIWTVEEIRSLPEVRKRLRGNSLNEAALIRRLQPDLDGRLQQAIDQSSSETVFSCSPEIQEKVRAVAYQAKTDAGGGLAVIVTSPIVRPFARKIVAAIDVSVLSYREIFPGLVPKLQESNERGTKHLYAAAGN